jgi:hypothetical protein
MRFRTDRLKLPAKGLQPLLVGGGVSAVHLGDELALDLLAQRGVRPS